MNDIRFPRKQHSLSLPELELLWPDPPDERQLTALDVHIWASNLNRAVARISSFEQILSAEELDRASRFYFERDRCRFIAGRGILREILGSYLEMNPSQLHFSFSSHGKPYLGTTPLHFNVTHSEDLVLVAVSTACTLGIDIERIRPIPEFEDIAINYFSMREAAELMALPQEQQRRAFYRMWTCKEASIKAAGTGLFELKRKADAAYSQVEPAKIRAISENNSIAAPWTVVELRPAPEYVATLAAPATGLTLSSWQWSF
jgi:4'-phosphopantetheinyl transferase